LSYNQPIAEAFLAACQDEIRAPKPGNVHVYGEGHGMTAEHFLVSASAATAPLCKTNARVGDRILAAVEATSTAVGMNTNLGILLLCAPLAAACENASSDLRQSLAAILRELDRADAEKTFNAIARALPGGLGHAERHDVQEPARVGLREAMAEAAGRDRIAYQYVSDFEDIFVTGRRSLCEARARIRSAPWQVVAVYLTFLATFPDTHILRKYGASTACAVQEEAELIRATFETLSEPENYLGEILAFDRKLKARKLNPGTSADLTVATLFADRLSAILLRSRNDG
jgi:triphosphoribosyl-dephospho-CoA synthase